MNLIFDYIGEFLNIRSIIFPALLECLIFVAYVDYVIYPEFNWKIKHVFHKLHLKSQQPLI